MSEQVEITRRDPRYILIRVIEIDGQVIRDVYEGPMPEELQSEAEQLIGDGKARVAVTVDMGVKDYGTGASASATISVACNQDEATIDRALQWAGERAREAASEQRVLAAQELEQMIEQRRTQQITAPAPAYGR